MVRRTVSTDVRASYAIHNHLPEELEPTNWSYDLALQLRLWTLANEANSDGLRVLLYFQIIEIAHPDESAYPKYTDASVAPHPMRECKLVRNLVAHGGKVRQQQQLKTYCEYLGFPPVMVDHTDQEYLRTIGNKVPLLHQEAKRVLAGAL